ncbi:MAG: exopolysaccharide biosynthesis polyprenyl glycosylphosphotransferase [Candidatus Scalindua sp.]
MRIEKPKLFIILLYELIFFASSCLLTNKIIKLFWHSTEIITFQLILILGLFFSTYFYLMWKNLYSRNYHYYEKNTFYIVIMNIFYSILFILIIVSVLIGIDRSQFFPSPFLYLIMGAISFFLMHGSQFLWIKYLSRLGYFRKNILVIGNPDERFPLNSYFQDIGNTKNYAGMINYKNGEWVWKPNNKQRFQIINDLDNIKGIILKENIGEIIFFLGEVMPQNLLLNVVNFCQDLSISYYLVPDIKILPKKHPWNKIFPYIPILERFSGNRDSLTNISIKRLLDIIISSISLILFIPLGMLIALAIKIEDGGPVFYITTRIGKNGLSMRFYKFRTMIVEAEKEKQKLLKFNERSDGPLFKMKNDPRITKVGRILRKHSFDEFPQMLNVFLGNMSLIGPRPHLPEEVAEYKDGDYLRLECMPGIVGLPQITGRNTSGFREWVDLDLKYRKNWSLTLDFKIMLKTIRIIITPFIGHRYSGF